MSSVQITVPIDKGSQKFTIGEIARMILETHESSPTVDAQDVITEIMKQAQDCGEPPVSFRHGIETPEEEIVFVTAAGRPYKSAVTAARAARIRADLQDIDWGIVSVDGGWGIQDITTYTNWFEYFANKETMTADEIGYMALVSTADMTRFCRSTVYREWASQLGLGVPVMFGGKETPLAKGLEDALAQALAAADPQERRDTPAAEAVSTPAKADQDQTEEELQDWFVDVYVPAHKDKSPNPTRDAALAAAESKFTNYCDRTHLRDDLRKIWRTHAPTEWKKPGPRAKIE